MDLPNINVSRLTDDQLFDTIAKLRNHQRHAMQYGHNDIVSQINMLLSTVEEEIQDRESRRDQKKIRKNKEESSGIELGKINGEDDGDLYDFKF